MKGFGVRGSCLHWDPLSCSPKPHCVGDGQKNGNTPISPSWARCRKLFCLGSPHRAVQVGRLVLLYNLLLLPDARMGFKTNCLKGSHSVGTRSGIAPLCPVNKRASGWCLQVFCPWRGSIPSSHSTQGRTAYSHYAPKIATESQCWLPSS